ncbi:hypothetical protein BLA29_004247, partial [Euroglyphus maynei]
MSDDPDRKPFLDKYFQFLDECGKPLNQVPTISKVPVDLYRLYMLVKERGGYLEVTNSKMWKDCAQLCNIANSSSASYTLRKQYMKHLLAFECKFDRGGIDVGPLLAAADASNVNRKKSAAQSKLTNSGRSTPTTPRLSPNDSPSVPIGNSGGVPSGAPGSYHPGHPQQHQGMHPGYPPPLPPPPSEMDQNNYGPNEHAPTYHHPHPQQGPYPPPPPHPDYPHHNSQQQTPYGGPNSTAGPNHHHPHHPNNIGNHESVSVKDPFADEDNISSPSSSSPARIPKSATGGQQPQQQQQQPPPPPGQYGSTRQPQHYPMPNPSGSFYGHASGPPPNSGPPHANSGYPDGYPAPDQPPHYPQRSNSAAPESAPPPNSVGGNQNPYGSRMTPGMNGPMHSHHPPGPYYGHGSYGQQQQPPYATNESHPGPVNGPQPPPSPSMARNSYEQHHSQHSGYPAGHRYPLPNNAPGQYPNRLPYGQPPPPSQSLHPHHSSSNANVGSVPPAPAN